MKFVLKYLDKFLKVIKTDRNTFIAYVLTLITAYILVDRIVELIIMWFTGNSVNYWGPIKYTLAMLCPWFAYFIAPASKFASGNNKAKVSFFYTYCIALYIIGISFFVQSLNRLGWLLLLWVPNYKEIIMEFSELIRPAFTAMAIYLPIITFYPLIKWMYTKINDPIFPNTFLDSINDYTGLDLNPSTVSTGQYSFEIALCRDRSSGKAAKILEDRRFQGTLILGPTGVGKTSMVLEPMIAQDLEKKYFFNEVSKEMGYTALKTGLATLNCPYDNQYLNDHFSLTMLTPAEGKESLYKAYMKKMIYSIGSDGKILYRNLGLTSISPEPDHTQRVAEIAKAFNIPVTILDPNDPCSPGINPFAIQHGPLCALIITDVLKSLYDTHNVEPDEAYMQNSAHQAIQNLVILLKLVYPKLHPGDLPNLEDVLLCFTNFDYIEELCHELEKDEELAKENALLISYFEENFYKNSTGYRDMKRYTHFATSQLDYLFKTAECKAMICNRHNNIDYREFMTKGEVVLLCSRYADFGGLPHRGIVRFFIGAILRGIEDTFTLDERLPNFIYMDGFDFFAWPSVVDLFTMNRKLKVGTIIAAQTLSGIDGPSSSFMQKISANSPTKLSFGNCTPEDYAWWEKEFGERREWIVSNNYNSEDEAYQSNLGNVQWGWKNTLNVAKQQGLAFKECVYKTKDKYGKNKVNFGSVDFLPSKYLAPHKTKFYDFAKYNTNVVEEEKEKKERFDPKKVNFDSDNVDPIQTDTTDASFFFDNEDAISFNLGGDNNKK